MKKLKQSCILSIACAKKIDTIEEKYFVLNQMDEITFEKFHGKYKLEKDQILLELSKIANPISNNGNVSGLLAKVAEVALKMPELCVKVGADKKDALQKLVFPEGIVSDRHKGAFRTTVINPVFEFIPQLATVSGGDCSRGFSPFVREVPFSGL